MGTVGIAFGSPTSGQGFNVSSTVSQIVANMQAVETPWNNQLTQLASQDTAYSSIGTDLATLTTDLQSLTNFQGVLAQKQGSSSDTNILQLTSASNSAVAGSHTITVNSLASTASYSSNTITNASDLLSGSMTFTVGSTPTTVSTAAGGETLAQLASQINSTSGLGLTATVINDPNGSLLSIVSNTSGSAGNFSLSSSMTDTSNSSAAVSFTQGQAGADASLNIDGVNITSGSNTVTNAVPGVTFQLLSSSSSTPVQVEITNNNAAVETAVNSFVTAYNQVMSDINTQEGNTSSGTPEPLYGNPNLGMIQNQLQSALTYMQSSGSGSVQSITQLGIGMNNDGTLTYNSSALDSLLNSNYQDVANFLQPGSGFTSFGDNFTTTMNNLGNAAPDGIVYLALQSNQSTEQTLNTDITNENAIINTQQQELTTELNQANYTLTQIPQQLDYVNQLYSSFSGYNINPNFG